LNLQEGSIVIQSEVWWNRNLERQTYARCWRQGQNRAVKVFRLITSNSTIDSTIKTYQTRKDKLNNAIMEAIVRKDNEAVRVPGY
jgi:SNF2 family DNA or RNA helicase